MTFPTFHLGDCIATMRAMPDASVDSIVTDPPYELGFMGKSWDASGIAYNVEMWREALRVLKPGGHLLAFSGSRTYHRMTCAIEDAGFEIRDQIMWVYGSGFPKSLDVSKAIDKHGGQSVAWFGPWLRAWREENCVTQKEVAALFPSKSGGLTGCVANWELGLNMPTPDQFNAIREHFTLPFQSLDVLAREVIGQRTTGIGTGGGSVAIMGDGTRDITAPATDDARQWQGWGTALKPAHEPICVARKPLAKGCTVAANVLKWGTGALNIDECRVPNTSGSEGVGQEANGSRNGANELRGLRQADDTMALASESSKDADGMQRPVSIKGNDGSGESSLERGGMDGRSGPVSLSANGPAVGCGSTVVEQSGIQASARTSTGHGAPSGPPASGNGNGASHQRGEGRQPARESAPDGLVESLSGTSPARTRTGGIAGGSAAAAQAVGRWPANFITDGSLSEEWSRYFYCAKASKSDRNEGLDGFPLKPGGMVSNTSGQHMTRRDEGGAPGPVANHHPTVKPTDLMRYLCRLVTPPGGLVLDPFTGSGSTGKAAVMEGFRFVGCELSPEYIEIARARVTQAWMQANGFGALAR